MTLCERFPALTPFDIRKQSVYEVFLLVNRLNKYSKKEKKKSNKNGKIIRRPAKDDSWF